MKKFIITYIIFFIFFIVGEARCFMKIIDCNWNPIGKAEIVYTLSFVSGLGFIVGWIDIDDN